MSKINKDKSYVLEELFRDSVVTEDEKRAICRAWKALSPLSDHAALPPRPSKQLLEIFNGLDRQIVSSTGNAHLLYQKITANKADLRKVMALADVEKRADIIVRMGTGYGLPVTREEVLDFLENGSRCELCDDELELVVGGKNIQGTSGDDSLKGSGWDDSIESGQGNDTVSGGDGNDKIWGQVGHDSLSGDDGNDTLYGSSGDDTIHGDAGSDYLSGGRGDDSLYGDAGDDKLQGDDGDDALFGGDGNDILLGGDGDDTLFGGAGSDILVGNEGDDVLTGGQGQDVFAFNSNAGNDVVTDFDPAQDSLNFTEIESMDQLGVEVRDGNTIITYGNTTVTLEGVEMTLEEIWARVEKE